ncbi:Arrestin C-terminal-like domain-containing protein [Caenorhabditis elegans]|uniref:Arrestin C-terminal-like domain-containing protein n=1 Tax=Caenorhabditis elegans TaxID=6239 RepID=Q9GYT4_CAEEL|nr:Arrestin C-terminal-like domain-containing protein [Caenorhabditis elegans]CCD64824.1 Arrestin C-terminal-like domain-containing protein [Caenorhabditis elegans]|eukprot:NP_503917.1 ARRestin Domain protein [Caenorhabditis elegans]
MPDTELHVIFNQPDEVFHPGKPISGRVVLSTTKEKYKARAVNIKILGLAHTSWTDTERVRKVNAEGKETYETKIVNYSANVNYLDYSLLLWASSDGSNELAAGEYAWPFSYTLPINVPPSFEGKYGYLRYSVTAEIDRPWRVDKDKKRCITVSPLIDLNVIPHALTQINDQASENLGCCCFTKGYLELRVNIPKTGFVPGETVPMNIHILNHSSVPVTKVKAKIIQQCKFIAYRNGTTVTYDGGYETSTSGMLQETQHDTRTVVKQGLEMKVAPRNEHKFAMELRLPSVTPTINQFSPVITVEYIVQFHVETSTTCGGNVDCEMSILIGTVPISKYLPPAYYPQDPNLPPSQPTPIGGGVAPAGVAPAGVVPPPGYGFLPMTDGTDNGAGDTPYPVGPPYPSDVPAPYPSGDEPKDGTVVVPSAPPLSYEESMYGTEGTELNTDENAQPFAPKYPVFNDLPVYNPTAPPPE